MNLVEFREKKALVWYTVIHNKKNEIEEPDLIQEKSTNFLIW